MRTRRDGSSRRVFTPAFSLIELIASIAIVAALIGISLPSLHKARESARAVECRAKLRGWGVDVGVSLAVHDRLPLHYYNAGIDFFFAAEGNPLPTDSFNYDGPGPASAECPSDTGSFQANSTSYLYKPAGGIRRLVLWDGIPLERAAEVVTRSYELATRLSDQDVIEELGAFGRPHHAGGPPSSLGSHALYFDGHVDWHANPY